LLYAANRQRLSAQVQDYSITVSADEATSEYEVVLYGPGIGAGGRRYTFRNPERCAAFAEAMNFAFRQGVREGRRQVLNEAGEPLLVVSGSTPESLLVRRERWWQRLRRRLAA
jgi:hypothetical protein